jgi:hypothetical protein
LDSGLDTLLNYIYTNPNGLQYSIPSFWDAGGTLTGSTGVNVWNNCNEFEITSDTYGIVTGNSNNYGPINPTDSGNIVIAGMGSMDYFGVNKIYKSTNFGNNYSTSDSSFPIDVT